MSKYFPLFVITFLWMTGCHQPTRHPENLDPIYDDITREHEKAVRELESLKKDVDKAKKDFEEAPIRTGQREDFEEVYFELTKQLQLLREKELYLAQKLQTRAKADKNDYLKAFNEGKGWPKPEEYQEYMAEKRLKEAPRDWNVDREIFKRFPASLKKPKVEEKKPAETHE